MRCPLPSALLPLFLVACVEMETEVEGQELGRSQQAATLKNGKLLANPTGGATTFNTGAAGTSLDGEFFADFGTNGRVCGSCHLADQGWTVSAADVAKLFDKSRGTAPIFRPVDGANSPLAPVGTVDERRAAYSMLRSRCVF
jgi:hypothetical protein